MNIFQERKKRKDRRKKEKEKKVLFNFVDRMESQGRAL